MAELPLLPDTYSYTDSHEWVSVDAASVSGSRVRVGITAVASDALGEVVYVEAPAVGTKVRAGEVCGEIESTKSVSDLYAPVSGVVLAVNELVTAAPATLNTDPYGEAWLFEVQATDSVALLSPQEYAEKNHL